MINFNSWLIASGFLFSVIVLRCTQLTTQDTASTADTNEYVGRNACQPCHKSVYNSFLKTGMGRSLYQPLKEESIERFGPEETVYDPQLNFFYQAYWLKEDMFIREFRLSEGDTTYKRVEKVDYIIGSGHQTRSYLMERNGYWYEFPITWYVGKQIWDLSPGYKGNNSRFSREIGEECLACHTGNFEQVSGSRNKFGQVNLGIDCEQCHGPGKAHIETMRKEGDFPGRDYVIVNPSRLPPLRQFDVCQQCHLQGVQILTGVKKVRGFRPGMELKNAYEVFIEQDEDEHAFGIASHAERLQQSRCYIRSAPRLNCTSCHNPHKSIDLTDPLRYIRQCQNCHDASNNQSICTASSEEQLSVKGNCITCHMPEGGTRDIPHVSFHDHKIRVVRRDSVTDMQQSRGFLELLCATNTAPSDDVKGQAWLQYFERFKRKEIFLQRADSLISYDNYYDRAHVAFFLGKYTLADTLIKQAIAESAEDAAYYFLQGEVYEALEDFGNAAIAYQHSYQLNPESIDAGLKYGVNILKADPGNRKTIREAGQLFEILLEKKPFDKRTLSNLSFVRMQEGRLTEALTLVKQALAYDPDYGQALFNLCGILLLKGDLAHAKEHFEYLGKIHPEYPGLNLLREKIR